MNASDLRGKIMRSLRKQGFHLRNGAIIHPRNLCKEKVRKLHQTAVQHHHEQSKGSLSRQERNLLSLIASGHEVKPHCISPRLVEVLPNSNEELLFRYASLHWSIPVSSGYGRRIRFLVVDDYNSKLIGLIGLGDPVFNLGSRDQWVGWSKENRIARLQHVMDAFVLGAVPPYSFLLCGKLVAMLVASDEIREAFRRKYGGVLSVIRHKKHDGRLALITTTSALGRSSIYNRVRFGDRLLYCRVGFTKGSGEFHFSNGLYGVMSEFSLKHCKPTAKQKRWGTGFRNRREVVKKCLPLLGLSSEWLYHGVEREVFMIPLAKNTQQFLRGEHQRLHWFHQSASDLFSYFRSRWLLPRSARDKRYLSWSRDEWLLWNDEKVSCG